MIEILRGQAGGAVPGDGCTQQQIELPARLASSGLLAVQFHHFEPDACMSASTEAGSLRFTAVVDGMLAYSDSLGHADSILGGEVQLFEPAEAVRQELRNSSGTDTLELVSLLAKTVSLSSTRCSQRYFSDDARRGHLCTVASPDHGGDALATSAPLTVILTALAAGKSVIMPTTAGHESVICVMTNAVSVDGQVLRAGNCAAVPPDMPDLRIESDSAAEVLIAVVPVTTGPVTRQ